LQVSTFVTAIEHWKHVKIIYNIEGGKGVAKRIAKGVENNLTKMSAKKTASIVIAPKP